MADLVGRLDEGAADIVIADDAEIERNARFGGVADRRRDTRIRHRDDDVGGVETLARLAGDHAIEGVVNAHPVHGAVGVREIDPPEDGWAPFYLSEGVQAK